MSNSARNFRELLVWQRGMEIAQSVYAITRRFPKDEVYGLRSQLRRAAASVPANIAEGNARDSTRDYLRHLSIAVGSLAEVETFVELATRLHYCSIEDVAPLIDSIHEERMMLHGLQRSLRSKLE